MKKILIILMVVSMLSCASVDKNDTTTQDDCEKLPQEVQRALCN